MKKIVRLVFVLVLILGSLSSCTKEYKTTMYQISFGMEDYTDDHTISDPEVKEVYRQILEELAKVNSLDSWQVEILNDKYEKDDQLALDRYNSKLQLVKAAEARCRKKIEELGTQGGSSFHLTFVCKLSRWVAADSATKHMQEYRFELKYN